MNIRIGDYSIVHQSHNNVTVMKHGKVTDRDSKNFGNPTAIAIGYYANTRTALCAVLECKIAPLDVVSIGGVIEAINAAKAEIIDAVERVEKGEGE